MKQLLFLLSILLGCSSVLAQGHLVQVNMEMETNGWIYMAAFEEDRFEVVDSLWSDGSTLLFTFPEDATSGVYRLVYDERQNGVLIAGRFVEFIYDGEDLNIRVEAGEQGPLPIFEQSVENEVYQDFVSFQLGYEQAIADHYPLLVPVRYGDPDYRRAVEVYEGLQRNRIAYMDSISETYPELYATRMISAFRIPVVPGNLSHRERMDTLKSLFFQEAPIDDPALLHAPVYSYRIIDYLSIYQDASLDREAQEGAFMEAVDGIMVNLGHHSELRTFVMEFLLEGFELLGMEEVQVHLAENYLDENCMSDLAQLVRERMEADKAMKVGNLAPDFVMRDHKGRNLRLSSLPTEHVLLVFWSTTCGHCRLMMPDLLGLYDEIGDAGGLELEVVAYSVDTSATEYAQYLEQHPMEWVNVHDPLGWNGKVPGEYHIYATPTMFLLDARRRILARPVNMKQLRRALRNLQLKGV